MLFSLTVSLYGGGRRDNEVFSQVDSLIAEKRYNQALLLLSSYSKDNPDDFRSAQKRIRKILKVRERYNTLTQQLLDVIERGADPQRMLDLSGRLIDLDPERIAETQNLINRVRDIAQFRYYRDRLDSILTEGSLLIGQKKYAEAMKIYAGGLDMYQAEFFAAGYGQKAEESVRSGLEDIHSGIPLLDSMIPPLAADITALENLKNQSPDPSNFPAYREAYRRVAADLERFASLRTVYEQVDVNFTEQLDMIHRSDPDSGDSSFPAFAIRLLEGRAEEDGDGMLGVIDTIIKQSVIHTDALVSEKVNAAYASVYSGAVNQQYGAYDSQLNILDDYASLSMDAVERWGRYNKTMPHEQVLGASVPAEKAGDYAANRAGMAAMEHHRKLNTVGERFSALEETDSVGAWKNGGNADALIVREQNYVATVRNMKNTASEIDRSIEDDRQTYAPYQQRYGNPAILAPFSDAKKALENLNAGLRQKENASLSRQYTIANGQVETRFAREEQDLNQGIAVLKERRPSQALPALTSANTALDTESRSLNTLLDRYASEGEASDNPEFRSLYNQALTLRERLENARGQGREFTEEARSQTDMIQNYTQTGNRLYTEARNALSQSDFDRARDRLLQAGENYDASLSIEDSPSLRQTRDVLLPQLDAEIARLENEAVIRDVNNLLTAARDNYYRGDFDRAEESAVRAQNRWRVTQTDENQEISSWLNIIRSALLSRSGRTIPPTAPLYAEMSQLLSDARKNYDEGVSYLNANLRNDGIVYFDNAREKTQKVRLLYPLNEDAGILELRMDRETDRAAFDANFNNRLQTARAGAAQRSWQAYADLQNLRVINPNYPNWNAIIYEAEIAMAIRLPPPDPQRIAASQQLTSEARAIVNANPNNELQLRRALELTNQALAGNPDNADAARLASRIYVLLGGASAIFDHNTEQKYRRAGVLLQQNNPIEAYGLAQEIARDPRYRNNSRLLDLLQRIRANL